jgi:ribonuclease-3
MAALERRLGYRFRDPRLLVEALSHRSIISSRGGGDRVSNERLEFLGDTVLDLIVALELFQRFPSQQEGDLTQLKSLLVSRPSLEKSARDLGVGEGLRLSVNEAETGGRDRPSILADALEALIGAVFVDGGLEPARRLVLARVMNRLPEVTELPDLRNYKSLLLEHVQRHKIGHLSYRTAREEGPDHRKRFTVEVLLNRKVLGSGCGDSKKQAQQEAARSALDRLGLNRPGSGPKGGR